MAATSRLPPTTVVAVSIRQIDRVAMASDPPVDGSEQAEAAQAARAMTDRRDISPPSPSRLYCSCRSHSRELFFPRLVVRTAHGGGQVGWGQPALGDRAHGGQKLTAAAGICVAAAVAALAAFGVAVAAEGGHLPTLVGGAAAVGRAGGVGLVAGAHAVAAGRRRRVGRLVALAAVADAELALLLLPGAALVGAAAAVVAAAGAGLPLAELAGAVLVADVRAGVAGHPDVGPGGGQRLERLALVGERAGGVEDALAGLLEGGAGGPEAAVGGVPDAAELLDRVERGGAAADRAEAGDRQAEDPVRDAARVVDVDAVLVVLGVVERGAVLVGLAHPAQGLLVLHDVLADQEVGALPLAVELGDGAGDVGEGLVEAARLVGVDQLGVEAGEAVVELVRHHVERSAQRMEGGAAV